MIGAGDLDREITILRDVAGADDAMGAPTTGWQVLIETRAKRTDVRDSEKVAAGRAQGSIVSRFVIRAWPVSRTITTADSLFHNGAEWQIHGVKEVSGERRLGFIEISASTGNG